MQPACAPLSFLPGDSFTLTINLYSGVPSNRVPYVMAAGEVFTLLLGRILASTADPGPKRLQVAATQSGLALSRIFTPQETLRFANPNGGQVLTWAFARIPAPGSHRTYAQGQITLVQPQACGAGDRALDLTVSDDSVVLDLGIPTDAASYTDIREAAIRQDEAAALKQLKTRAYAAALLS